MVDPRDLVNACMDLALGTLLLRENWTLPPLLSRRMGAEREASILAAIKDLEPSRPRPKTAPDELDLRWRNWVRWIED